MGKQHLNEHQRRRLQTAEQSIADLNASIVRCQDKLANLDTKRETLERAIISKREAIRRIRVAMEVAKQ